MFAVVDQSIRLAGWLDVKSCLWWTVVAAAAEAAAEA